MQSCSSSSVAQKGVDLHGAQWPAGSLLLLQWDEEVLLRSLCSAPLQQEVMLVKSGGPLGLSIVGGSDHASHPFGINEPGVFISKVRRAELPYLRKHVQPLSHVSCSSPGDRSRPGVSKRTARGRQNTGGERHRPASCHAPGGRARAAGQQAGDPYACAERPLATWDAGAYVTCVRDTEHEQRR